MATTAQSGAEKVPRVSVVIPTYRRERLLERCLNAVLAQDFPAEDVEIIVIDDGGSDAVNEVAERLSASSTVPITVLHSHQRGPAAARNTGWRAARGEVIAFLDDDAYPADEHWLGRAIARFDDAPIDGLMGPVEVPLEGKPTDFQRNVKGLEDGEFLTCNVFYRRAMLERVGGFDERFQRAFREDSDLQYRIMDRGAVLVRDDAVRVIHPAPEGPFAVSLKLQRNSMFNALMYRKHPYRYRTRLQRRPPFQYYAIVLLTIIATVAGLGRQWRLMLAAGSVAVALDATFLVRRLRGVRHRPRDVADLVLTSALIPFLAVYWRLRGAARFRVVFL